ncbi:hypothetical protein HON36_04880 [Candidatus Parcubacteria bacterium]|jgi:hypothetical protein|nr:hypothetical protein [Candidatus Parcubacteria bacterium]MBT7228867.1 hypothetical protein [Candidatus Parcubacteria bacterium]
MRDFFAITSLLVITGMMVGVLANAATTAAVSATVTAQNISVTVSDAGIAYGVIAVGSSASTTVSGSGLADAQTATNNGNVNQAFNIIGVDSASWELGTSPASETYTHYFCNTLACESAPTWTEFNEDSYTTLSSTTVPANGTQIFDLRLEAPSATAVFTEQTVDITVQAVSA